MSVMAMIAAALWQTSALTAATAMGAATNHRRSKDTYEATNYMSNHHDWKEYRPCSVEEIENRLTKFSLHTPQVSADDVDKMLSKVFSDVVG